MQDFETKLEECLAINDNPSMENKDDMDESVRRPIVKRQPRGGDAKNKKTVQKGRATRGRKVVESSESESDSEVEKENPRREKAKQRVIESDSDDDVPLPRKIPQASRKPPIRASRSNRSKVIEELSTSGEGNVLRENNSFEN